MNAMAHGIGLVPRGGNPSELRHLNRKLILFMIATHGPISRVQLAEVGNLSRAAVSAVVGELMAERLLLEVGQQASGSPGRRATLLALNPDAHLVLGVELGSPDFRGAVVRVTGEMLESSVQPVYQVRPGRERLEAAYQFLERMLGYARQKGLDVKGIGVSVPGVTDVRNGYVTEAPTHGWKGVPLGELVQSRFNLPTVVENDSNAGAAAEGWIGQARGQTDAVVLHVGSGIGAGLIIGGRLHRGAHNSAGEAGFLLVDTPQLPAGERSLSGFGFLEANLAALLAEARADAVVELLGRALVNITALIDPGVIIFSGPHQETLRGLIPMLETYLRTHLVSPVPRVVCSTLGFWSSCIGAARLVHEEAYPGITGWLG